VPAKPDFSDPAYHEAVLTRLTAEFGNTALNNALRELMEDERIKALVPEGSAMMGRKTPVMDISSLRYTAIGITFKNMADPAPPYGEDSRRYFMMHFTFDKRLKADPEQMTKALRAITDSVVKLQQGGYTNALN
jgi:hypothetical protein